MFTHLKSPYCHGERYQLQENCHAVDWYPFNDFELDFSLDFFKNHLIKCGLSVIRYWPEADLPVPNKAWTALDLNYNKLLNVPIEHCRYPPYLFLVEGDIKCITEVEYQVLMFSIQE